MNHYETYDQFLGTRTREQLEAVAVRLTTVDEMTYKCLIEFFTKKTLVQLGPDDNYVSRLREPKHLVDDFLMTFYEKDLLNHLENLISWCKRKENLDVRWNKEKQTYDEL